MKKFLTQQINFGYAVIVMMMLTVGVGMTSAAIQPSDSPVNTISPLIHQGGGEQAIAGLRIGSCNGGTCIGKFDVRGALNNIALFDSTSAISPLFLVTGNVGIVGKLFVGEGAGANLPLWTTTYGSVGGLGGAGGGFTIPLQRVNVYGNARATNLTNSSAPAPVCVNPNGMLLLCGTAPAINGQCATPPNGGTYSTPPTTGLCSQGEASTVTTNPNTYNWTCNGINGGTTASCQANRVVITNGVCHDFGAGPFPLQPATGANGCDAGSYEDTSDTQYLWKWNCNGSANGGQDVACTEPRTQTYHWHEGNWGTCTGAGGSCSGTYITFGACSPNKYVGGGVGPNGEPSPYEGEWCGTLPQNLCPPAPEDVWLYHPCVPWNPNYQWPPESCVGLPQGVCGDRDGCTWNATPGTQTRTVACHDQNHSAVSESFCNPATKPATSQSC